MDPENTEMKDEPSTSSSSISISRRRMAFRQPPPVLRERLPPTIAVTAAPPSVVEVDSQNSTISLTTTEGDAICPDAPVLLPETKPPEPPKRKAWSFEEVCAFYEGIKIHGKDFDSVVKFMAKRKIEKTKDHIKTFFFNSVKAYRQLLSMTDDDFANIPRDARELFLLINACEWKRKTMNMKVVVDKLKELLFEGSVLMRVNRRIVTIKTPPCPALCRYFSVKKADKVPTELYVHLEPTSNGDHVFMRNRNQNPYVRVKLNTNDRIMKLLEFLHKKWSSSGDCTPISVTLWPDSSCEVASLSVHSVESSPFISLSMNKLIRNVEETRERTEPKKPEGNGIKLATDVNIKTKSNHTVIYPRPFTLTDKIIAEGINYRNVRNAIVAELFCVCGRKNPIQLRYQIHCEQPEARPSKPWKLMIDLLDRGYGDCLAPSKSRRRERPAVETMIYYREPVPKKKKEDEIPPPEPFEPPGNPESEIVRQENEDFECQLALLRKTSRQKNVPAKRKSTNPVLATGTPQLAIRPAFGNSCTSSSQCYTNQVFASPKCTVIPKKTSGNIVNNNNRLKNNAGQQKTIQRKLITSQPGPSTSNLKNMPTDFSSVQFSPAKRVVELQNLELQKKRTEAFLSSLQTPIQTPKKPTMQQLFGDELSLSPNSTRHASHLEPSDGTNQSVVDFTEMMYQHIQDQGETTLSNPILDFSVSEVHQHYNDMMTSSQNSHDYLFDQFQKKKMTPKKKK